MANNGNQPIIFGPDGLIHQRERGAELVGADVPLHVRGGEYWCVLGRPEGLPADAPVEGTTLVLAAFTFQPMAEAFMALVQDLKAAGMLGGIEYGLSKVEIPEEESDAE